MIDLNYISTFFPSQFRDQSKYGKHLLKEYMELMVLDYLSSTKYIKKMAFIGGTNLRLVKGLDRFSEDLDFDLRDMTEEEFSDMTRDVVRFLHLNGLNAELKENKSPHLTAFRCNIYFPQLLFDMNLSGHRDERFLLKIEAQDQRVEYDPVTVQVRGCGFFFTLPVPPDSVLLAMKLSALLARGKGRDFYDVMFLFSLTEPDYSFLEKRVDIKNKEELKKALKEMLRKTDLNVKKRDFEHLLFNNASSSKILRFPEFLDTVL